VQNLYAISFIRTIPSVLDSNQIGLSARGLIAFAHHHRWGLTPRPETDYLFI